MSQSQTNWEADKMLDVYIYDYLIKRKLHRSAKAFQTEENVSIDPVATDAPGGFLFEWWSVYWDIYYTRTNRKHSEAAASYIETQLAKKRELQQQQIPKPQSMQMQQLSLQRQALLQQQQLQQQQRDENQHLHGSASGLTTNDVARYNSAGATLAAKIYVDEATLPLQRDSLDEAAMKQRLSDNMGQLLDQNALGGQPPSQPLHGTAAGLVNLQHAQILKQQLQMFDQEMKSEMNAVINTRADVAEGSLIGVHGSNQGGNNLTLKGWPLTGLDPIGLLQQQRLMQSLHKFQLQQNLASPSIIDLECRKMRMLLDGQNMGLGKDSAMSSSDIIGNIGSPVQVGSPMLPRGDADMLLKQQLQSTSQQQQQYTQQPLSSQQTQNSNHQLQQLDKIVSSGSISGDGSMSSTFQGNEQASKSQIAQKRMQPGSSSGPANSSCTANTAGLSPSSLSSPSTHAPGDTMSMSAMWNNGGCSNSLLKFASDGLGSLASAPNELADMDHFMDDRTLDDNVDSFFSHDPAESTDKVGSSSDINKGLPLSEIQIITASTSKVECCHFSSDGKLLATGGHDRKVTLWCTESFTLKSTLEGHSQCITDVRFSPTMSCLATASADKTIKVWGADNPGYSLRTFTAHSTTVMSVDFHPSKGDLICSCDNDGEIRYWSIRNDICTSVFKGGATQVRFQPHHGRNLAAATENTVSILDVETQHCWLKLGHISNVQSVCWDPSGKFLASVSDDLVRVWMIGTGSKGACVNEWHSMDNKFHTCIFHPSDPSLLIIGCSETLEVWNMSENKKTTLHAHDKLVSALAASNASSGLVASASHDKCVKIWK